MKRQINSHDQSTYWKKEAEEGEEDHVRKKGKDEEDKSGTTSTLIPPNLATLLHPHQRQAVDFLLSRLIPDHHQCPHRDGESESQERGKILQTGAILADDMGTGKVR